MADISIMVAANKTHSDAINKLLQTYTRNIRHGQKLALRMARDVRKYSKANVRQQRSPDGRAFTKRADQRQKRKMLLNLGKKMDVMSMAGKGGGAKVSWRAHGIASVAYKQSHGFTETWTPQRALKAYGKPKYDDPCTRAQAKALIAEGFRLSVKAKGKKRRKLRRVSVKWLQTNWRMGQAGRALRLMREEHAKTSWRVTVPPRPFLGLSNAEENAVVEKVMRTILDKG